MWFQLGIGGRLPDRGGSQPARESTRIQVRRGRRSEDRAVHPRTRTRLTIQGKNKREGKTDTAINMMISNHLSSQDYSNVIEY
jgi:hypothetical protein